MFEVKNLTKQFGALTAVNNISFSCQKSEMIGIIGKSGAGKSTLLRMINRLNDATSGNIIFHGNDILTYKGKKQRAWQAKCAMIFQQFNLVPRVDVVSNVLFGTLHRSSTLASIFNLFSKDDIEKAMSILDRLGVAENFSKRAEELSGGQQQRVAISRALMQDPEIILADEPIASLDPMNAQIVMDSLRQIHDEDGRMIICNLHTLDTARNYCDRIIGMRDGNIVFDGLAKDLNASAAREIYGASEGFSEKATSTSLESLDAERMIAS